jgi:2-oxoglutarate ferredoxin oxidoreductase subunit alpha
VDRETKKTINILIGGEAGQGLVTVGQILAKTLVRGGYYICVTQDYQSRIRGGHNTFAIRAGVDEVRAPQEAVDILVALTAETVELHRRDLSPQGLIVGDEGFNIPGAGVLHVPFKRLSSDRYTNIVSLGVIAALLDLDEHIVSETVTDFFGKVHRDVAEENRRSLGESYRWAAGQATAFARLASAGQRPRQLMMNGNEAIALGAVTAGLKFYAFYPMTPSTSIALALAGWAKEMGLMVEQAEDEIAAINMALGASLAGAPSMVGTSGGGFALMVEGVSLAAMTETPVVIAVAQRPAPATGLPTRTSQADLEFVLHAGHGEFPRAVFTPGSIEQCFALTQKALQVADRYQGPAFILTDQFLADSYRAVAPFRIGGTSPREAPRIPTPYHRYALTEDGISPRLLPGLTKHLVVVDSDEHTEDGHITEDLAVRTSMVQKRLKKGEGVRAEVIPPELQGAEKPDLLLVTWGSSKGAVEEAADMLRSGGTSVATLHFPQVWPLVPEHFLSPLQGAKEVIAVEGNATGQLARLIRRETGFHIVKRVLRYDGLPITPEFILRELNQ